MIITKERFHAILSMRSQIQDTLGVKVGRYNDLYVDEYGDDEKDFYLYHTRDRYIIQDDIVNYYIFPKCYPLNLRTMMLDRSRSSIRECEDFMETVKSALDSGKISPNFTFSFMREDSEARITKYTESLYLVNGVHSEESSLYGDIVKIVFKD